MKRAIAFLIAVVLLFFSVIEAQEVAHINCAVWVKVSRVQDGPEVNVFYLRGVWDGANMMAVLSERTNERRHLELIDKIWPQNLTFYQIKALIDEYCQRPGNRDLIILEVLARITHKIN